MNRVSLFILATITLAGCAGQQAINEIEAACKTPSGVISSSCAVKHPQFKNLPQADQRAASYANVLYEQVDNKQLTKSQADYLYQEYIAKAHREQAAIDNANAAATSNAMMMTGAALMAADAANRQPVIYPAPQKMYPTSTTCMGGYRSLTCTNF